MRRRKDIKIMGRILAEFQEMIGRDMAEVGLHADAAEMNTATFETLKKECETISPRSHEYHFLAGLYGFFIFIDDDMENGKIRIGMRKHFMEKEKYKAVVRHLKEILD